MLLSLTSIRAELATILSPTAIHTVILCTTSGQLLSVVSNDKNTPKSNIRVIINNCTITWERAPSIARGYAMAESGFGKMMVIAVKNAFAPETESSTNENAGVDDVPEPLLLLIVVGVNDASWKSVLTPGQKMAAKLSKDLSQFREFLMPSALTLALQLSSPKITTLLSTPPSEA